ncbi:hypothetical protein GALL_113100 [mine drainage metagenome]|uniref:Uncharacterized protein n=1 Tax=mine drainage metagenome TaxID=410659 RepID=A0A1J5SE69_9ZZZZ
MLNTGVSTVENITPVESRSTLCRMVGIAMNMLHVIRSSMVTVGMSAATNAMMIDVMIVKVIMAIRTMIDMTMVVAEITE